MSQFYVTDRELINKLVTRKLDIPQSFALGWQCSITISFQFTFSFIIFFRDLWADQHKGTELSMAKHIRSH